MASRNGRNAFVLLSFGLSLSVSACGSFTNYPEKPPHTPKVLGGTVLAAQGNSPNSQGKEAPLQLKVAQAFFVGENLNVKVRLTAKASMPSEKLVVGVIGLHEGNVVETHYARIKEITNEPLVIAGQSVLVPFELSSHELTEYQVSGSWGEEAVELWAEKKDENKAPLVEKPEDEKAPVTEVQPSAPPKEEKPAAKVEESDEIPMIKPGFLGSTNTATLEGVELQEQPEECTEAPCDIRYTILARVVNRSRSPLTGIKLAVGISWSENKSLPRSPANGASVESGEELVDLKQSVLDPGQSKKLRVKVARAVPVIPGGAFLPYIRVVSSEIVDFSALKK